MKSEAARSSLRFSSGSTAWILLAASTSSSVSSFSWPQPRRSLIVEPHSRRRRHGVSSLHQMKMPIDVDVDVDRITTTNANVNGTDWLDSQRHPASRASYAQDATGSSPSSGTSGPTRVIMPEVTLLEQGDKSTIESMPETEMTLLEQELIEGYVEYQALLNSVAVVNDKVNLEEQPEPQFLSSHSDSISTTSSSTTTAAPAFILTDVWKARLLLLLSAALYGTNFTFVKSLDESMSVGLSSTLRFGFAAFVMLPWLFAPIDEELKVLAREKSSRKNAIENNDKEEPNDVNAIGGGIFGGGRDFFLKLGEEPTRLSAGLAGMEIGMYNAVGYIAQAVGLKTTTASKSAFICSMAVVTVPLLDYIWGKKLLRRQIIGACLAAFGVYALELGGQETTITDGEILSLVQPIMFGLGFWRMEAAVEKYPTEAARLAAAQLLMVFVISLSYLLWSSSAGDILLPTASEIMTRLQDPYILGTLFWTGVVTTAFTIYMETVALKTLSAAETTLIFSTEPLFGAAFAAVVANECLGMDAAVGATFIIGGCIVSGMDVGSYFKGGDDKAIMADADALQSEVTTMKLMDWLCM